MTEAAHIQQLMGRLADGDRSAFDPLFEALWPAVFSMSVRLLGDEHHAEDAAQATMLAVFRQAPRFDPSRRALAWVMTMTYWECRTVLRRRQRAKLDRLFAEPECSGASPESEAATAQLMVRLEQAMEGLSPMDREQILADLSGSTPKGVSPAAVRKRRQRALDRLRDAWRKLGVES